MAERAAGNRPELVSVPKREPAGKSRAHEIRIHHSHAHLRFAIRGLSHQRSVTQDLCQRNRCSAAKCQRILSLSARLSPSPSVTSNLLQEAWKFKWSLGMGMGMGLGLGLALALGRGGCVCLCLSACVCDALEYPSI